jgi:16S rRNA (cytosine1402-N4)-methyltransferase
MRMNPHRGQPASALVERCAPATLAAMLADNADEPRAELLAAALAGRRFDTTRALADAVRATLPGPATDEEHAETVRRVFQALRIAVNDELGALEMFLRNLPACLRSGGRVAVLTFHSGEDRRVKKSFEAGQRDGVYAQIAREVVRPSPQERHDNPRSAPAKLRWAIRSGTVA